MVSCGASPGLAGVIFRTGIAIFANRPIGDIDGAAIFPVSGGVAGFLPRFAGVGVSEHAGSCLSRHTIDDGTAVAKFSLKGRKTVGFARVVTTVDRVTRIKRAGVIVVAVQCCSGSTGPSRAGFGTVAYVVVGAEGHRVFVRLSVAVVVKAVADFGGGGSCCGGTDGSELVPLTDIGSGGGTFTNTHGATLAEVGRIFINSSVAVVVDAVIAPLQPGSYLTDAGSKNTIGACCCSSVAFSHVFRSKWACITSLCDVFVHIAIAVIIDIVANLRCGRAGCGIANNGSAAANIGPKSLAGAGPCTAGGADAGIRCSTAGAAGALIVDGTTVAVIAGGPICFGGIGADSCTHIAASGIVALIAGGADFGIKTGAGSADAGIHCCAGVAVVAHGVVIFRGIGTLARSRITNPGSMTLVARGTGFVVASGAGAVLAGIGLRTGIAVGAGIGVVVRVRTDAATTDIIRAGIAIGSTNCAVVEPVSNAGIYIIKAHPTTIECSSCAFTGIFCVDRGA